LDKGNRSWWLKVQKKEAICEYLHSPSAKFRHLLSSRISVQTQTSDPDRPGCFFDPVCPGCSEAFDEMDLVKKGIVVFGPYVSLS